jgi:RNA polymerase sigma-70 factor (ECF subfamily)
MAKKTLDNEIELLGRIADGDQRAFTTLYDFYHRKIYTFSLSILQSESLAEEVVQEAMLKLWVMGDKLTSIHNLDNYLKSIAHNLSIDLLRKKELSRRTENAGTANWLEEHNETEESILLNDTKKLLDEAVSLLPNQQRLVYELAQIEGLKNDQIAEKLNIAPSTAQTHMKLALRFVRNHIRQHTDLAVALVLFKLL